ncbi:XRE family transcriptional regulator [Clostridium fungisolvens]|uniref:XRE family transcriptional regulator n=1 Tax=Clostridium fungisolvens TaxID=1604897 RepID=A0A6V8SJW3_9CLOT|nr:XRE family transcriptional regulator [Clostridium fungisolvens]GFP77467.1 hypothetical protein bsdtw1_03595 [Clostridium fungisolvens]
MNINVNTFQKLIEDNFYGSYNKCAKALNVAPSTICRVVNGNNNAGVKLLSSLMQYCNDNNLRYEDYIFLQ